MDGKSGLEKELEGPELWRRQCARNLMDCYSLGVELLNEVSEGNRPIRGALEAVTRLMVDGMTAVRTEEDEKAFYRTAAGLCRECANASGGNAGLFRVYAAIFDGMSGEGSKED